MLPSINPLASSQNSITCQMVKLLKYVSKLREIGGDLKINSILLVGEFKFEYDYNHHNVIRSYLNDITWLLGL